MKIAMFLLLATVAAQAKPWLGVGLVLQEDTSGGRFLFVVAVPDGTPAAKGGLQARDLVTAIDGKPIRFRDELDILEFLASLKPEQIVKMRIVRAGKAVDLRVRVGRMPRDYEERWAASLARARDARQKQQR